MLLLLFSEREVRGRGHTSYCGHVLRPGSPLIFVRAAEHKRLDRQTAAQKKHACTLWTVKFVRGETARFCSAGRENQFVGFGADKLRELIARVIDRRACLAPRGMHARWIPEMSVKVR